MRHGFHAIALMALLVASPVHAWEKTIPIDVVTKRASHGGELWASMAIEARKEAIRYAPRFIGNYEQLRDNDLEETFFQVSGGYIFIEDHKVESVEELEGGRFRVQGTASVYVDEAYMEERVREVLRQAREGDLDKARETGSYDLVIGHPREGQTPEERVKEAESTNPELVVSEEEALHDQRHKKDPPPPPPPEDEYTWGQFWNAILTSSILWGIAALI